MRFIVGVITVLGLAVTVAVAQPPVQRERGATLKAPQPLAMEQQPLIARGAIDDFLPSPSLRSTPVARSSTTPPPPNTSTPPWLSGVDPNVLPAGGTTANFGASRPPTPPTPDSANSRPSSAKWIDRLRGRPTTERQSTVRAQPSQETPTASSPFRSTGANGAQVYAGPPAYRWYGWGSVTPGSNPLAPTGQYPRASANWYSITGATPGAFPVPVSNPAVMAGTEPPSYGQGYTSAPPAVPVVTYPQAQYRQPPETTPRISQPDPPPPAPASGSKFMSTPSITSASPTPVLPPPKPVSVPTMTPPPIPNREVAVVREVAMPLVPTPKTEPITVKEPPALPTISKPVTVLALPPIPTLPSLPTPEPTKAARSVLPTTENKRIDVEPKPLPTSVMTEPQPQPQPQPQPANQSWQPATQPASLPTGTWAPEGRAPMPAPPVEQPSSWQSGSVTEKPVVARGQISDKTPDPIGTLIRQLCQGRASGVEIRWTGTKKLQVCFEVSAPTEAKKLVADISRRPELTPYQIDFCVLVK